MKKTVFSLAFIAASGVYVAAANHLFAIPQDDTPAIATNTALRQASGEPVAPTAPATPPVVSPPPAVETAPPVARPASGTSPTPSSVQARPLAAEIAPIVIPPLPRPRPAPPTAAVRSAAATTAAASSVGLQDGTYTGSSENAYYGRVQVQVTIASHRIATITVLDYPKDRRTSRYINSQALPLLQQEVIAASSANVDTISGATLTSEAYLRSLGKALSQAGGASA